MSNQNKILGQSRLNYAETVRQYKNWLAGVELHLRSGVAHFEFHQRGDTTRATVRARTPGEECLDLEEALRWIRDLRLALDSGNPCGKISLMPNGNATEITVQESTN